MHKLNAKSDEEMKEDSGDEDDPIPVRTLDVSDSPVALRKQIAKQTLTCGMDAASCAIKQLDLPPNIRTGYVLSSHDLTATD